MDNEVSFRVLQCSHLVSSPGWIADYPYVKHSFEKSVQHFLKSMDNEVSCRVLQCSHLVSSPGWIADYPYVKHSLEKSVQHFLKSMDNEVSCRYLIIRTYLFGVNGKRGDLKSHFIYISVGSSPTRGSLDPLSSLYV